MRRIAFAAIFSVIAAGCGSSTDSGTTDQDSSISSDVGDDTVIVDTGARDTATTDSAKDSTTTDTSTTDSSTTDAVDSTADTTVTDTGGDTSFACGDGDAGVTCTAGQVCTRTYVSGGACMLCTPSCPTGYHCSGSCCAPDTISYSYACKDKPSSCSTVACTGECATALCGAAPGACGCEGVGSDGVVTCHVCAP